MKPEFQKYLKNIGVTKPIQNRVEHFYCLCRDMAFGQLLGVFIDEYLTEDKTRKYTGLSFFSQYFIFSVTNFLTDDKIEIFNIKTCFDSITIIVENFDFKKANDKSLMSVQIYHSTVAKGGYKASQKNCEYLVRILRKYIRPSLMGREIKISS